MLDALADTLLIRMQHILRLSLLSS